MEELLKHGFEHKYLLIGLATSLMGAFARISYEKETKVIKSTRKISYFTTAIFVGYIIYELCFYWNLERLTGVACALGGLISIDIIRILIEELPSIVKKKIGAESDKHTHNNKPDE
jgi:hypothetical protein